MLALVGLLPFRDLNPLDPVQSSIYVVLVPAPGLFWAWLGDVSHRILVKVLCKLIVKSVCPPRPCQTLFSLRCSGPKCS